MANTQLTQTGAQVQADLNLTENLQDSFSTSSTYAVGGLVIYDGKLWKCHTAVSNSGSWTGTTNWTQVHLSDIVSNIKSWFLDTTTTISSLKNAINLYGVKVYSLNVNGEETDITQDVSDGDYDDVTVANSDFASYTRTINIGYDYDNHTILLLNRINNSGYDGCYLVDTALFSLFYGSVGSTIRIVEASPHYPDRWLIIDGYGNITATVIRANSGRVVIGDISSSGATNGQVLTANGSGGVKWDNIVAPSVVGTKLYLHELGIQDISDCYIVSTSSTQLYSINALTPLISSTLKMVIGGKIITDAYNEINNIKYYYAGRYSGTGAVGVHYIDVPADSGSVSCSDTVTQI